MRYLFSINRYLSVTVLFTVLAAMLVALIACNQPELASGNPATKRLVGADKPLAKTTQSKKLDQKFTQADAGLLLLLVPDDYLLSRTEITAWLDAASEVGVRLQPITDKQFIGLGVKALKFAGLILPDQSHQIASNELVSAVKTYTDAGGNVMLVFDFGVYALDGNQKPTYAIPKSRLSDLAGVDYVLYDELREKSTVVGPVTAMRSTMRALLVPPGKSVPYSPDNNPPAAVGNLNVASAYVAQSTPAGFTPASGSFISRNECGPGTAMPVDVLESYSGYLLGNLMYSSFATKGAFKGQVLATSPGAGLVAGLNSKGKGQILFVNLPLTYLKVMRTDALPMHGFLNYFARDVLSLARLSQVPNAVAGLTLNWHLDSFTAQLPTLTLEKMGVFSDGPFSIDITAGPDAVTDGDGKGWNLKNNPAAKEMLRRFVASGHEVGSHGGWNHDYYGLQANENNQQKFLSYLQRNVADVSQAISNPIRQHLGFDSATPQDVSSGVLPVAQEIKSSLDSLFGPVIREYSPPVGNNPTWAMDWLEQQGIVAVYFAGHTGLGPTRQYRAGQLRNASMWVFPVTPAGKYATFEEFQTNLIPKQQVINWYRESVDFVVAQDTTRMIYMHPNGANVWPDVLRDLLTYAKTQGKEKFRWYTMTRLADFMTARENVEWTELLDQGGTSTFEIYHPNSLKEMVWLLPKTRYPEMPFSADGSVTSVDHGADWAVRAGNTSSARFTARADLSGSRARAHTAP